MKAIFVGLILMLTLVANSANAANVLGQSGKASINIFENVSFIKDSEHRLTLTEILDLNADPNKATVSPPRWQPLNKTHINFLYDPSTFWFKFPLIHQSRTPKDWVLDIDWPFLDSVDLFLVDEEGELEYSKNTGDHSEDFLAGNTYRLPHFSFTLQPQSAYTVLLRVKTTSSVIVPIRITETAAYQSREQALQAIYGVLFGALFVMAMYNAIISIFTRDKSYAYYVAYLLSVAFYMSFVTGFGQRYAWGYSPWLLEQGLSLSVAWSFLFGALFVGEFLGLKTHNPFGYKMVRISVGFYGVMTVLSLFAPEYIVVSIEQVVGLLACFLVFGIAWYEYRNGNLIARYFLIAWSALLFGTCAYTLLLLGLIPRNIFTENIQIVGIAIEMLLLAVALADRINMSRIAREAALEALFETAKEKHEAKAEAKARGEFFAKMSHEIRTPIGGVMGVAELLKDTPLNSQQHKFVDTIYHSGESLLIIVNDILDFSKMDAGKLELEEIPFQLRALIRECIDIVAVRVDPAKISFHVSIDDQIPDKLKGDPVRLRQILLNFLSNAVKFTPQGQIHVEIKGQPGAHAYAKTPLTFRVVDSGIGLTEAQAQTLFKPFQQADKSTTRRYGGTGLGLAICKELVELMDGTIGVSSEPGEGATFWFSVKLPVCDEVVVEQPQVPPYAMPSLNVLVAEDNPVNSMVIKGLLNKMGVAVEFVTNGKEAVKTFKQNQAFDCILMDCEMPEMDGFQASDEIRDFEQRNGLKRTPIIALTAHSLGDFDVKLAQHQMDLYLMKPPSEKRLLEAFQSIGELEPFSSNSEAV